MKKLLVLLLVLGMTSLASATTVSLTDEGTTITETPGAVILTISSDGGLYALNVVITVAGGDMITDTLKLDNCAGYGWDPGLSFDALTIGTASAEAGVGTFGAPPSGVVGFVEVAYTGGTQIVSIAAGSAFGGSGDVGMMPPAFSTGVVTIIPEPMTIALLGLGGLALLRRRK